MICSLLFFTMWVVFCCYCFLWILCCFWWVGSLWLHYVTVSFRVEFYLLCLYYCGTFWYLGRPLFGLSFCILFFLLGVFLPFVGSLFYVFFLVGLLYCFVGFFLWVFDAVFGVSLYCITVVVLRFIVDVVRCCCFGSYLAGLTCLIIRSSLVEIRCFSLCVGSLRLF